MILKLLYLVILSLFVLTGCWDYVEVEEQAIVLGAAVDIDEEDTLLLTVEIASSIGPGPEAEISSVIVESKGDTFLEASRNALSMTGKRLFWSHAKIIILSPEIVNDKKRLSSILDFFSRYYEPRDDAFLLISIDGRGRDILEGIETELHPTNALYLSEILFRAEKTTRLFSTPVWKFQNNWKRRGISPVVPGVKIKEDEEETLAQIDCAAIISDQGLVGWLDCTEMQSFLFLTHEVRRGVLSIRDEENNRDISLRIITNKTLVNPIYKEGELTMRVQVETKAVLLEFGNDIGAICPEERVRLEAQAGKALQELLEEVVERVQREYQTDIFGFGQTLKREHPSLWREKASHWEETFTQLEIQIDVSIDILRSGLL